MPKNSDGREKDLAEREQRLREDEERVQTAERDLEQLRVSLREILKEVNSNLNKSETEGEDRLAKVAEMISTMDTKNAAQLLEGFTPDEAARILQKIKKERDRGAILDEMGVAKAALIMRALREGTA